MIIDVTGIELTPGNLGRDCKGNGMHYDEDGNELECCCNECDYLMGCQDTRDPKSCATCPMTECPHCRATK